MYVYVYDFLSDRKKASEFEFEIQLQQTAQIAVRTDAWRDGYSVTHIDTDVEERSLYAGDNGKLFVNSNLQKY